jgi:hypothetical protein
MLRIQHLLPVILITGGCAVRHPAAWRLQDQILTPPGAGRGAFTAQRGNARGACPGADAVAVDARKGKLKITVNRGALEQQPRGWLADWAARAEGDRCLAPGQAPVLAERVLDSVPLTTSVRFRLLRADDVRAGYIDLGPENRLEVISPILRPGASEDAPLIEETGITGTDRSINVTLKASPDLIGHETAWYAFEPKPDGGTRIAAIAAETSIQRQVEPRPEPAKNYFTFGPETGFYRLFYKADQTAVIVGTASRGQLPKDLDGCNQPGGPTCITIPKRVGVNPLLVMNVNSKPITIPAHMPPTVRSIIVAAKLRPEDILPTISLTKPYDGKPLPVQFDRSKRDILELVLAGDEVISFSSAGGSTPPPGRK